MQIHKVKLLKVITKWKERARKLFQLFSEVSESRHSSLVLVGAPAQRYHPLSPRKHQVLTMRCSFTSSAGWISHDREQTWARLPTILRGDHRTPIVTEPSRWCLSPRVISYKLSLDLEKPNWCVLYIALMCTNEVLTWDCDFTNHLTMQCRLACSKQWILVVGGSKTFNTADCV
jgi:hypothetical protein